MEWDQIYQETSRSCCICIYPTFFWHTMVNCSFITDFCYIFVTYKHHPIYSICQLLLSLKNALVHSK